VWGWSGGRSDVVREIVREPPRELFEERGRARPVGEAVSPFVGDRGRTRRRARERTGDRGHRVGVAAKRDHVLERAAEIGAAEPREETDRHRVVHVTRDAVLAAERIREHLGARAALEVRVDPIEGREELGIVDGRPQLGEHRRSIGRASHRVARGDRDRERPRERARIRVGDSGGCADVRVEIGGARAEDRRADGRAVAGRAHAAPMRGHSEREPHERAERSPPDRGRSAEQPAAKAPRERAHETVDVAGREQRLGGDAGELGVVARESTPEEKAVLEAFAREPERVADRHAEEEAAHPFESIHRTISEHRACRRVERVNRCVRRNEARAVETT
jgi:hypothetical protein